MIVVLDTNILGGISNPNARSSDIIAMIGWAADMRQAGHTFAVPAIAVYEIRRELLRNGATNSISALDRFAQTSTNIYLPISDAALTRAAQLWAQARSMGKPTASDNALDGDVILCAQVLEAGFAAGGYIVATTNTKHLSLFVDAAEWQNITP